MSAGSRTIWTLVVVAAIVVTPLAGYIWFRDLWTAPPIPEIPVQDLDKETAELVAEARDALVAAPRSGEAWGRLGRVLLANEIFPDISHRCFAEAERLDPTNPRWPYFSAGYLAVNHGKPDEAIAKLRRATALADGLSDIPKAPRLYLAELLVTTGQDQEAADLFQKVLAVDPKNARAQLGLGLMAYARGDWQTCRKHLELCMENPQTRKKACIQLAVVCERLHDKSSAEKYASLAPRLPPDIGWPDEYGAENMLFAVRPGKLYQGLEAMESQKQYPEAIRILARLADRNPNDPAPLLMMGRILPRMGDLAGAEKILLKAKQLAPEKTQSHYLLGLVLFYKGETLAKAGNASGAKAVFEESVKSSRKALDIQPDFGYAHMALGLALKALDQRADAIAAFRNAVHRTPEFVDNHLFLGQALAEDGNFKEAKESLRQAQLLAPQDPRVKAALDKLPADTGPKTKS